MEHCYGCKSLAERIQHAEGQCGTYVDRIAELVAALDAERAKPVCAWCDPKPGQGYCPCPFHGGPEGAYELTGNTEAAVERSRAELLQAQLAQRDDEVRALQEELDENTEVTLKALMHAGRETADLQAQLRQRDEAIEGLEQGCHMHHVDREQADAKVFRLEGERGMWLNERIDLLGRLEELEQKVWPNVIAPAMYDNWTSWLTEARHGSDCRAVDG